jgi:hypothetical protein
MTGNFEFPFVASSAQAEARVGFEDPQTLHQHQLPLNNILHWVGVALASCVGGDLFCFGVACFSFKDWCSTSGTEEAGVSRGLWCGELQSLLWPKYFTSHMIQCKTIKFSKRFSKSYAKHTL